MELCGNRGKAFLEKIVRGAADFLYPNACALCKKTLEKELGICETCAAKVAVLPWIYCIRCGRRLTNGSPCPVHKYRTPIRGIGVMSDYNETSIRNLVWKYKYRGRRELSTPLSGLMAKYADQELSSILKAECALVLPMPLHEKRERARGFNQAELLAEKFAAKLKLAYSNDILKRTLNRPPQVSFREESKRRDNIRGVFSATNPESIQGKTILLVDDVATTGATLEEAAGALKRAGAETVWALVIARGQ